MLIRKVPGSVGARATRAFVAASTQYLSVSTDFGLTGADPFHLVSWAKRTGTNCTIGMLGVSGSSDGRRYLTASGSTLLAAASNNSGGATTAFAASAANSFTASGAGSGWHSAIGEWESATSRRVIVDGVASAPETTNIIITGSPNLFRIGANMAGTSPADGQFAHVALFAGTASDALIALAARGTHPTQLPGALIECWDLDRVGPVVGLVRGTVLAPTGGGSLAPGPRIQGPPILRRFFVGAVAGGGGGNRRRRLLLCGSR
jgi:hypothetical protein